MILGPGGMVFLAHQRLGLEVQGRSDTCAVFGSNVSGFCTTDSLCWIYLYLWIGVKKEKNCQRALIV